MKVSLNSVVVSGVVVALFSGSAHAVDAELKAKMAEEVTTPYSTKFSPHTFKRYKSRNKEISKLRIEAAALALQTGSCDFAEYSEIKNRADGPINNIDFFVSCQNGERFLYNEKDIKAAVQVKSINEQAWSETKASEDCLKKLEKNAYQMRFPKGKLDIAKYSIIATTETSDMSVQINIPVDVDGTNGITTKHWATCSYYPGKSSGTIQIHHRDM